MDNSNKKVVLVTGSSGLVGWGIKTSLNAETDKQNEEWVFLSSKDKYCLIVFKVFISSGYYIQLF